MRVLFWSQSFPPSIGGVEVFASRLLAELRRRGHEILVVADRSAPGIPGENRHEEIRIVRFPFLSALDDGDVTLLAGIRRDVAALRRRFAPDLTHVNALNPSVYFHLATSGWAATPFLITLHAEPPPENLGPDALYGRVLDSAAWIACCSSFVRDATCKLVPGLAARSSVISPFEVPHVTPTPAGIDPPLLLCLGRLAHEKGFDLAIRAMPDILARVPMARLTITGDGPERAALEALVAELGVGDAVELTGWIAPCLVPELMNRSSLVVVPSRQEAFGLTALEAAAVGRPVIAARVGGLPEIVEPGRTGLFFEKDDAGELARLATMLLTDERRLARMGAAARRAALRRSAAADSATLYEALYSGIVAGTVPSKTASNR